MKKPKKKGARVRATVAPAVLAKVPEAAAPSQWDWRCTRTDGRIDWQAPPTDDQNDWVMLATSFGIATLLFFLMLVPFWLLTEMLAGLSMWWNDAAEGTTYSVGEALLYVFLFAAFMGCFVIPFSFDTKVTRFEFDIAAASVVVHETRFPNRRRVIHIPFADVGRIYPFRSSSCTGVMISLQFWNTKGEQLQRFLGSDLPAELIEEQLDCLRPALEHRVWSVIVHD